MFNSENILDISGKHAEKLAYILKNYSYNINLQTGKFLSKEEFFKDGYKDKLFSEAQKIVKNNPNDYVGVDDKYLKEIIDNFECVTVTPNKTILISYTKYDASKDSNYPVKLEFKVNELKDVLTDELLGLM